MNNVEVNSQISYTAKSRQVKDAQWVIHALTSQYPHFSSSRIKPKMAEIYSRVEADNRRDSVTISKQIPSESLKEKLLRLCSWHEDFKQKCLNIRQNNQLLNISDLKKFYNLIKQLEKTKFGNCSEDAFISAVILKMNNVKNVYIANLKADNTPVDHTVCIFNTDGSKFDGKFKKCTMIIDSWLGQADFAHNLFITYKNYCEKFFPQIKHNSNIGIEKFREVILTNGDILWLNLDFENLRFPEISHEFMK